MEEQAYNYNIRRYNKYLFNKYALYGLLGFLIVLNVLIFPDLLNNRDIKLNDMSYLIGNNSNNQIGLINNQNEAKVIEENKIVTENSKVEDKDTKVDDNNNPEILATTTAEIKTTEQILPTTEKNDIEVSEDNKTVEENTTTDNENNKETPIFLDGNQNDKTTQEEIPTTENDSNEKIKNNVDQISTESDKIIPLVDTAQLPNNNTYLLFLSLIFGSLLISFGIFIYNNYDMIKLSLIAGKTPIREYLYPGYELLQD